MIFPILRQAQKEREEMQYPYSGSDDETPETNVAGEPSSILHAPGENTLRKNFQAIQEHNKAMALAQQQQAAAAAAANGGRQAGQARDSPADKKDRRSSRKEEAPPEPGPPSRPPLPHRLGSEASPNSTPLTLAFFFLQRSNGVRPSLPTSQRFNKYEAYSTSQVQIG